MSTVISMVCTVVGMLLWDVRLSVLGPAKFFGGAVLIGIGMLLLYTEDSSK